MGVSLIFFPGDGRVAVTMVGDTTMLVGAVKVGLLVVVAITVYRNGGVMILPPAGRFRIPHIFYSG